jgi:hypothetical protein
MRITGLLILLLFLVIFFAAPAASYAQSSSASASKSAANAETSMAFDRAFRDFARRDGMQIERNGVCYTMRTYVMAREEKDSDVTYPVRVTRCMPDSRLEFKSAVAPALRSRDGFDSSR